MEQGLIRGIPTFYSEEELKEIFINYTVINVRRFTKPINNNSRTNRNSPTNFCLRSTMSRTYISWLSKLMSGKIYKFCSSL